MAVQPQTPYIEHIANGTATGFNLGFDCDDQDHLIVLVNDVEPVFGSWSLTGGAVVFGAAPTSGNKITIQRNTPFERKRDYQSYDNSFRPPTVNKDFDWIWLKLQELGVADWILGNRLNALKGYVDKKDDQLQENIDNLKGYVDLKDDELRAYLMEEILKQGVALDQLDDYYNYLMQRLAQIAVDKGWDASFVTTASNQNQQEINDFGGAKWWPKPLGYKLGATVKLENGETVKSTAPANTVNPNVDMTGWVLSFTYDVGSVAALRLTTPVFKGQRITLKSFLPDNNKGGGTFIATQKSGLVDNGITVFSSPDPLLFWVRAACTAVTPEMGGAKGDGVANDYAAIQKVVEFIFSNKLNIDFESNRYGVGSTIFIPQLLDNTFQRYFRIDLDCKNVEFVMLADTTLFESAYYNGSNELVSSFGTSDDFRYSFGVTLQNFVVSSSVGYLTAPAIKVQDWHQGCEIKNIASYVCQTILHSHNSYYTKFIGINGSYSDGKVGNRFIFSGAHNLCAFQKLIAVNSEIGYKFDGYLTASVFEENSLEGMTIGVQFNSYVYNLYINGNYEENVSDVCYQFNDYAYSTKFDTGYTNFVDNPNMCLIEYTPLPFVEIEIGRGYSFQSQGANNRIIKNKEDIYGHSITIHRTNKPTGYISDLLVDNTVFGKNIEVNQLIKMHGLTGNVVNNYAVGNYSGRYTNGMDELNGATWVNLSNATLRLNTRIVNSRTQKIYVNLFINIGGTPTFIAGEFIGGWASSTFYKYTNTGLVLDTGLSISVVDGFVQIDGTFSGTITSVVGEVRLI